MIGWPSFGAGAVFDHVGVAVKSIRAIAGDDVEIVADPRQRVSVAFLNLAGVRIELIEPIGDRSPIDASLEKSQRLVHLCFRVPNLEEAMTSSRACGLHQLARPVPAPAFGGRRIAWMFSPALGLIELVEESLHA